MYRTIAFFIVAFTLTGSLTGCAGMVITSAARTYMHNKSISDMSREFTPSANIESNKSAIEQQSKDRIAEILAQAHSLSFNGVSVEMINSNPNLDGLRGLKRSMFQTPGFYFKHYFKDKETPYKNSDVWENPGVSFGNDYADLVVYFSCPSDAAGSKKGTIQTCVNSEKLVSILRDIKKSHTLENGKYIETSEQSTRRNDYYTGTLRIYFGEFKHSYRLENSANRPYLTYFIYDRNVGLSVISFGFPAASTTTAVDLFTPISNLRYIYKKQIVSSN